MNPQFLEEELKKTKQNVLIDKEKLVQYILDNMNNYKNGEIVEIDRLGE